MQSGHCAILHKIPAVFCLFSSWPVVLMKAKIYNINKGAAMKIIKEKTNISELKQISEDMFGNLVKAVIDVEKGIIAVGGELHSDEEALLLEKGSEQKNLWGFNIYPYEKGDSFIEFDSMINIKPSSGNRTRSVDAPEIRERIMRIVEAIVEK